MCLWNVIHLFFWRVELVLGLFKRFFLNSFFFKISSFYLEVYTSWTSFQAGILVNYLKVLSKLAAGE